MNIKNIEELKELLALFNIGETKEQKAMNRAWYYIGKERKIEAIKYYREATGSDLVTSKQNVEYLMKENSLG